MALLKVFYSLPFLGGGVHADTVGRWLKLDKTTLALKTRWRKPGDGNLLTPDQEDEIRNLIIDKTPDHLKMVYAL